MKVLIYPSNPKAISKSGMGRAIEQQKQACLENGIQLANSSKENFDIAHLNTYGMKSYRLMKKLEKRGVKTIVHAHSTHEDFRYSFRCWKIIAPFYNMFLNRMYKHAKFILTPTPYSKALIESYKGVKADVHVISNGIDVKSYAYNPTYVEEFKKKFNIKDGQKVVMSTGFYFKRKGVDDFIEIARHFPDITFIWFGYLNKILTTHQINKAIKNRPSNCIFPGYIKGNIIKGAYQYATAFLFPSYEETEGIVTLEALASSCPLIVRDIPVYSPHLIDKVNCLKCKDNDGFIQALNYVLTHDTSSLKENGYQVAKQRDLKDVGKRLKELYEKRLKLD